MSSPAMSAMGLTLAEAIENGYRKWLSDGLPGATEDAIAAAVLAWMQQPAQIERMARAARPDAWAEDGEIGNLVSPEAKAKYYAGLRKVVLSRTRAAVRALAGEKEG